MHFLATTVAIFVLTPTQNGLQFQPTCPPLPTPHPPQARKPNENRIRTDNTETNEPFTRLQTCQLPSVFNLLKLSQLISILFYNFE